MRHVASSLSHDKYEKLRDESRRLRNVHAARYYAVHIPNGSMMAAKGGAGGGSDDISSRGLMVAGGKGGGRRRRGGRILG